MTSPTRKSTRYTAPWNAAAAPKPKPQRDDTEETAFLTQLDRLLAELDDIEEMDQA